MTAVLAVIVMMIVTFILAWAFGRVIRIMFEGFRT